MAESLGLFVQTQRITMEQISEFRQDLEGLVSYRAARQAEAGRMAEIDRLLRQAETLAGQGAAQWEAFMQADRDIHLALARLAGNPLHLFFLETVHTNFHRYHINAYLPRDEATIRVTLAELQAIVKAVSRGEAERAEFLAREHVRRATSVESRDVPKGPGAGGLHIHGRRSTSINFALDGVQNTDTGSNSGSHVQPNMDAVAEAIRAAKRDHDYVIASFHWGVEYKDFANGDQVRDARRAIDPGADLVLSHHPHVIQGIEFYNRGLIAYSLGDFVFDHYSRKTGEAFVLDIELGPAGVANVIAVPVYLNASGAPAVVKSGSAKLPTATLTDCSRPSSV